MSADRGPVRSSAPDPRQAGSAAQTWTLAQLRQFHEAESWRLESDEKRRGAWAGERERRSAFDATVRLIDRIAEDRAIMERLKGK